MQALPDPRKVDEIVEKGTEVGVDLFLIVPAAASPPVPIERLVERATRWRRIAREAAKQSRRLSIPVVDVAPSLCRGPSVSRMRVAGRVWCLDPMTRTPLQDGARSCRTRRRDRPGWPCGWVRRVAGRRPSARGSNRRSCRSASLGREVLRTETAGPVGGGRLPFRAGGLGVYSRMMMDCIFCKIIAGDIPSERVARGRRIRRHP